MFDFSLDAVNKSQEGLEKKAYTTDERFYVLKKDENGNGAALVRFLPSEIYENGQIRTVKCVYKYNVQAKTTKKFINEWAPQTIGKPDPIHDKWQQLWNEGNQDEARRFARSTRYIANIKVISDPANKENEGKIFLLDMSKTLYERVNAFLNPPEAERVMGATPKNLFNPLADGYNFKLIARVGANGFTNYDSSTPADTPSAIYASADEAVKDINENCYKLSDWDKPEAYKSYEELKALLDGLEVPAGQTSTTNSPEISATEVAPQTAPAAQSAPAQSLDDLMASLGK